MEPLTQSDCFFPLIKFHFDNSSFQLSGDFFRKPDSSILLLTKNLSKLVILRIPFHSVQYPWNLFHPDVATHSIPPKQQSVCTKLMRCHKHKAMPAVDLKNDRVLISAQGEEGEAGVVGDAACLCLHLNTCKM